MNKIAYVTARSPFLPGETFLFSEMRWLKKNGIKLLIVPRDPSNKMIHHEAREFEGDILEVHLFNVKVCIELVRFMFNQPLPFFRLFRDTVLKARNLKIAIKNLIVIPKSIALYKLVSREDIAHIHAHWGSTPSTMAYIISRITGIPWSITLHRFDIYENNVLENKIKTASFVRCISQKGKKDLLQIIGDKYADKVQVIHMGVEMPAIDQNGNGKKFNKGHNWHICVPANLYPVKGHKYVIEAINYLKMQGVNNIQCSFYGDGPLENALKRKIKKHNLTKHISLEGVISHDQLLQRYLEEKIDILILPSIVTRNGVFEGIPVSLMEAMSYKIPVISTETGSIPELIGDGSGIMIYEKDMTAIAHSIEKLINDKHYYSLMSERGRGKVEKEFNISVISEHLLDLFSQYSFANISHNGQITIHEMVQECFKNHSSE